jgi:hypothetical protein
MEVLPLFKQACMYILSKLAKDMELSTEQIMIHGYLDCYWQNHQYTSDTYIANPVGQFNQLIPQFLKGKQNLSESYI